MLYKTEGVVIRRRDLGDFDRLLTVYTRDFGKILVKAKSVRKNQSKLRGHLELFLRSHLMVAPGRGFDIITGAETIESYPFLHGDLPSLAAAYYLSELADKLVSGPEKDERIWELFLSSLRNLDQKNCDLASVVKNFEDELLNFLGYGEERTDAIDFVQSLLNEEINSRTFLQKAVSLVE
ncbi:DNA repair protein RecO [Patescibacteria group bacterium]|nr:DNA repair protein RecO [Patescibacteria group bacterium]MBU4082727.1 DNA repair protein RecO [Patescibacteria group bacterium]